MNHYELKQELRRQRLEARAERLRREGEARLSRAREMASVIPFGQPILVGHHSEKRDRNYRGRIHSNFGKGFEALKEAGEAEARAASVGSGGVSSDDPEAVAKLKEQIEPLKQKQARMALANKLVRKGDREGLLAAGYPDRLIDEWFKPSWGGKCRAHEPWELSNNSANIRRIEERIEALGRAAQREQREEMIGEVRLVENVEANRLQLFFPGKPDAAVRTELKSRGFRWSPMEGAWQRHLSNGAVWAAKCVLGVAK